MGEQAGSWRRCESSVKVSGESEAGTPPVKAGEVKLEVVVLPVSDVDRAKEFYGGLGWRLDADVTRGEDLRLVQFTPPGSGCSIQFGTNIASGAPGSAQSVYLSDVLADTIQPFPTFSEIYVATLKALRVE